MNHIGMNQSDNLMRRYGFDALIVVTAVVGALEVALREDIPRASGIPMWVAVSMEVLIVLPLLGYRRYPFAAPALLWMLAASLSFIDGQLIPNVFSLMLGGMLAAYLLGNISDRVQMGVGLAIVLVGAAIVNYNYPEHLLSGYIFTPAMFAISWLVGYAMRERAERAEAAEERAVRAERERETAARIAVAEERTRIARELHDVVAHAVSVMVLQVGAVRHRLPQELKEDRDALTGAEQAGRTALAEMRRLLGAMRRDGEDVELTPQPGLDDLETLMDDVGRAGLPVSLHIEGDPFPLPRAIDLSAYRIVQEGLTNSLKHAHAGNADVTVRYGPDELQLEIRDDGEGGETGDGPGLGLIGVRERVRIYGGEMSAGTATDGGFILSARLPLGGEGR